MYVIWHLFGSFAQHLYIMQYISKIKLLPFENVHSRKSVILVNFLSHHYYVSRCCFSLITNETKVKKTKQKIKKIIKKGTKIPFQTVFEFQFGICF